jgi:hypothetical protein
MRNDFDGFEAVTKPDGGNGACDQRLIVNLPIG